MPKYKQRGLVLKICNYCKSNYSGRKESKYCTVRCGAKSRPPPLPNSGCFAPGSKSWNAGRSLSGMSGKKHSAETKAKMRESQLGDKAGNWKGGVTAEMYRIRRSRKYADWRKSVFERDDYTCQHCFARSAPGKRIRINADHIKPFASYPELRFDVHNGRTLCEDCHRKTPTWGFTGKAATLQATGQTFEDVALSRIQLQAAE